MKSIKIKKRTIMSKTFYADCKVEDITITNGENQKYRITVSPKPKNCGACPCLGGGCHEDEWQCNLTNEDLDYNDLTKISPKCPFIEI
jgi:hypothetical protein